MLSTESLLRYCQSESLSEEGLRDLFERHGVAPNNNHDEDYEFVFFWLCYDGKITEGIIRCFLDYVPAAARVGDDGLAPLHAVCYNECTSVNIVQLLVDAAPNSVRSVDSGDALPLHHLCLNIIVGEAAAVEILKLLIEKYPEGVRHTDDAGNLPLHHACCGRSPEFCRLLVEAYPGSEQIPDPLSNLPPFYSACVENKKAAVEYFYKLSPDDINHRINVGSANPVLMTIAGKETRCNTTAALEKVKFLLNSDQNLSTRTSKGEVHVSLLFVACDLIVAQDLDMEVGLQFIKVIFDADPEAIEENCIAFNVHNWNQEIQIFINSQLVYARQARDYSQMTTPDDNGQLPLHTALQNNVRLGSIKLLVKGNTLAVHFPDNNGLLPLHVACQHHDSTAVIQYVVGLDTSTLEAVDNEQNTALHYACRSAKYETIAMLLEEYDAVSISKQNVDGKLPLDLLLESNEVVDRESIEYTETIFRLLRAYPETVMNYNVHVNEEEGASASDDCSIQDKKRRRLAID